MKIALLGYGRMGKEIEKIATNRGHTIVLKADKNESTSAISKADVAIEFSVPKAALKNILHCFENQVPVVSGTTGWLNDYEKAIAICKQKNGAFIYASNFSIGVNIFFELNKILAKMMQPHSDYDISVEEIHHTKKLDAPSGTAITLAEEIIKNSTYQQWALDGVKKNTLPITAIRSEKVVGTHKVNYKSEIDSLQITHTAHNRKGFAQGALIAAEWLVGKKGTFTMKDVLNLGNGQ